MNVQAALKGQYHAAMAMLKDAVERCPDDLWNDASDGAAFWRVVYHALFFTHLYLMPDENAFRPWEHHRDDAHFLGSSDREPKTTEPYTKAELLDYWCSVDAVIDSAVDTADLDAETCGFPWYQLPKLDHQVNNIRHVQHHAALLAGRLRRTSGIDVPWVGFG